MKKILNIGCGDDKYGTDFVDVYPTRKEVIKCNVDDEELPFPDNNFDKVYAKFIFEHMKNQNNFLKKCYKVLKNGGKLVLITDNAGCWVFHFPLKFLYSMQHYENTIREGKLDRHYSISTLMHLKNHLTDAGFKNVRIKYMWFENRTITLKNHLLFITMVSIAKIISLFLPQKNSYPHMIAEAKK